VLDERKMSPPQPPSVLAEEAEPARGAVARREEAAERAERYCTAAHETGMNGEGISVNS
jgi:hypothetical protein